ncbi:hypothetical protein ABTE60_19575, partial [Acinetobacter baumannii]
NPNGLNLVTQYRYDAHGQVTRKIDARDNSTWFIYDPLGRLTESIDALGVVTRNAYDVNGNVRGTVRYGTPLPSATVAGFGNIVTSVSPSGSTSRDQRTTFVYDDAG